MPSNRSESRGSPGGAWRIRRLSSYITSILQDGIGTPFGRNIAGIRAGLQGFGVIAFNPTSANTQIHVFPNSILAR